MTSHYGRYVKEREGHSILETDSGFVTYAFYDTKIGKRLFVHDLFIVPENRRCRKATELCNTIINIAKANECTHIMSGVDPTTFTATESLKFQIEMGAKVIGVSNGMINLFYEIRGE